MGYAFFIRSNLHIEVENSFSTCLESRKHLYRKQSPIDECNYFCILMVIERTKFSLYKQVYSPFYLLLSTCFYNIIDISGAEDGNWCGVALLTCEGNSLLILGF